MYNFCCHVKKCWVVTACSRMRMLADSWFHLGTTSFPAFSCLGLPSPADRSQTRCDEHWSITRLIRFHIANVCITSSNLGNKAALFYSCMDQLLPANWHDFSSPEHKVHIASFCEQPLYIICHLQLSILHHYFHFIIFSSEITDWILNKIHRNEWSSNKIVQIIWVGCKCRSHCQKIGFKNLILQKSFLEVLY